MASSLGLEPRIKAPETLVLPITPQGNKTSKRIPNLYRVFVRLPCPTQTRCYQHFSNAFNDCCLNLLGIRATNLLRCLTNFISPETPLSCGQQESLETGSCQGCFSSNRGLSSTHTPMKLGLIRFNVIKRL